MGLTIDKKSSIFYIRIYWNKQLIKFSLRTRNPELAEQMYQSFLLNLMKGKSFKSKNTIINNENKTESITKQKITSVYTEFVKTSRIKGDTENTIKSKLKVLNDLLSNGIENFSDLCQSKLNGLFQYWQNRTNKRGEPISNDTMDKYITKLKAFIHYAIKQDFYSETEYKKIQFPRLENKVNETIIKDEDYQTIINSITEEDFKMYLQTLYHTGARAGEILNIKPTDLDFENHAIRKNQNKTNNYNSVVMDEDSFQVLANFIKDKKIDKNSYIFYDSSRSPQYYGNKFRRLKKKLGLNLDYNLKRFRPTYGLNLINETSDMKLVQEQLGHKKMETTARHYTSRNISQRKMIIDNNNKKKKEAGSKARPY